MHRSGTSLTASWVDDLGISLTAAPVHGPDRGNPKGHFEDIALVNVSAKAVRRADPRSDGWRIARTPFSPVRFTLTDKSRAVLEVIKRRSRNRQWGWKDPRAAVCLPEWASLIPGLRVLGLWRPAALVVGSLARRAEVADKPEYAVSTALATDMWCYYNEGVLDFAERHPNRCAVVSLESLVESDGAVALHELRRLGFVVHETPLSERFDRSLLRETAGALKATVGRQDVALIERRLRDLSGLDSS